MARAPEHIHLDAVGGAAGDMFVAALLDALPDLRPRVLADVVAVLPPGCGAPRLSAVQAGGIAALHFELAAEESAQTLPDHARLPHHAHDHPGHAHAPDAHGHCDHAQGPEAAHDPHGRAPSPPAAHDHHGPACSPHGTHGHPGHAHESHTHAHGLPHHHGTYADMRQRIGAAALAEGTAAHAAAILSRIAEAEAGIHGVPLDKVHFHEIGDWDSLMDVVAAGSIAAALPGVSWSVSALPLGSGLVKTAHGLLPVPVPAAAAILVGYDWRDDGVPGERVTPTGAAILAHLTGGSPGAQRGGRLIATGSGAGSRTLPGMPNILRASLFAAETAADADVVAVVECDIDDMTGEEIAQAADRLRALPAVRDLVLTPGIGKKGRPLVTLRLLADPLALEAVAREVFLETSTLGLRWHRAERRILPREEIQGGLPVKRALRPGGVRTAKAESDALSDIATLAARRAAKAKEEESR